MKISPVRQFLLESNAIEEVWDSQSYRDALRAWKHLTKQNTLTINVILETHEILMINQEDIEEKYKGRFRDVPVWVGGREGRPWFAIPTLMEEWLKDVETSLKIPGKEGEHFKLDHISFERIHPFINGNGRMGRLLLNWERMKTGFPIIIIKNSEKQEYYKWFDN